jgi:23S rRNA (guanosine2251-2'-O)-methyltransferase
MQQCHFRVVRMSGVHHISAILQADMKHHKRIQEKPQKNANSYWLYGFHAVRAALLNNSREITRMIATKPATEKLASECYKRGILPETMSPQEISRVLPRDAVHQGVALEVKPLASLALEDYLAKAGAKETVLMLDQVTDPHNVGAILRSAAAFGAGAVILTKDNAPQESAVLAKASSGGIEIVPMVIVTNLVQTMELLKKSGFWCIGLDGEAKDTLASVRLSDKTALILGAEGMGMRRLTSDRCDLLVRLPISSAMESLNVSNAAAVALYALAQKA